MATPQITAGMTCHIGKGKTLWEVLKVNEASHTVELSALGKGGYSNRTANADELTHLEPQKVETTLGHVIEARTNARAATSSLSDRMRFSDTKSIRQAARAANNAAFVYVGAIEEHNGDLMILGIKAE